MSADSAQEFKVISATRELSDSAVQALAILLLAVADSPALGSDSNDADSRIHLRTKKLRNNKCP